MHPPLMKRVISGEIHADFLYIVSLLADVAKATLMKQHALSNSESARRQHQQQRSAVLRTIPACVARVCLQHKPRCAMHYGLLKSVYTSVVPAVSLRVSVKPVLCLTYWICFFSANTSARYRFICASCAGVKTLAPVEVSAQRYESKRCWCQVQCELSHVQVYCFAARHEGGQPGQP